MLLRGLAIGKNCMSTVAETLHTRHNKRYEQVSPIRIKAFSREQLAMFFGEMGFTRGAEIGVAEGIYSKVLCTHIPNLHLLAVDLWDTYDRGDEWHKARMKNRDEQERCLALAHAKLDAYGATFIRKPSVEGARDIADDSLDFVYIDGNHSFDYVMQDMIVWSPKVRVDGIVALHDYYRFRGAGVVDAVNAYTHAHQVTEFFVTDQHEPTVFWTKPK
jgi:hypothetical protein